MRFACDACAGEPCEFRVPEGDDPEPPRWCPFNVNDACWREVPPVRSAVHRPGLDLLPGPFCEVPATAIVRATAEGGRYAIETGGLDGVPLPCSRAAFNEAVTAMEAVNRAAGV